MFRNRMAVVRAIHLALLTTALVVVTAKADPGPTNTTGCCNDSKTDCQGCVKMDKLTVGQQFWILIPRNTYTRCGTTGFSPDGCKEAMNKCYEEVGVVNPYPTSACANVDAFGGTTSITRPQCLSGSNGGENPCLD